MTQEAQRQVVESPFQESKARSPKKEGRVIKGTRILAWTGEPLQSSWRDLPVRRKGVRQSAKAKGPVESSILLAGLQRNMNNERRKKAL